LLRRLLFIVVQLKCRSCCITVVRCGRCTVHSRKRKPPWTFAVHSKA